MSQEKNCIFCKIIQKQIPSQTLHEDAEMICIRDIQPHAKTHLLVIPKMHIASLETAFPEGKPGEQAVLGKMFALATELARKNGLLPGGFRTVINTGPDGGQTVFHLHLHVMGGGPLGGKMA